MSSMVPVAPMGIANIANTSIANTAFKGIADQIDKSIDQAKESLSQANQQAARDQANANKSKADYEQASQNLARANATVNDPNASAEDKTKAQQTVTQESAKQQSAGAQYAASRQALKNDQQVIKNLQATLKDLMEHAAPAAQTLANADNANKEATSQRMDAQLAESGRQANQASESAKQSMVDDGGLAKAMNQSAEQVGKAITDTAPTAGDGFEAADAPPLQDGQKTTPDLTAKFEPGAEGSENTTKFLLGEEGSKSPVEYLRANGGLQVDAKPNAAASQRNTAGKDKAAPDSSYERGAARSGSEQADPRPHSSLSLPDQKRETEPLNMADVHQFASNFAVEGAPPPATAAAMTPLAAVAAREGMPSESSQGAQNGGSTGGSGPNERTGASGKGEAKSSARAAGAPVAKQQRGDATAQGTPERSVRDLQPKHRHEDGPVSKQATPPPPAAAAAATAPPPGSQSAQGAQGAQGKEDAASAPSVSRRSKAAIDVGGGQGNAQLPPGYSYNPQQERLTVGSFSVPMTQQQLDKPGFREALGSQPIAQAGAALNNLGQTDPAAHSSALQDSAARNQKEFWSNFNASLLDNILGKGKGDDADDTKPKKASPGSKGAPKAVVGGGGGVAGLTAGGGATGQAIGKSAISNIAVDPAVSNTPSDDGGAAGVDGSGQTGQSDDVKGSAGTGDTSSAGLTGMELVQVVLLAASQEAQESVRDLAQEVQQATDQKNQFRGQKEQVDKNIADLKSHSQFFDNNNSPTGDPNVDGSPANQNLLSQNLQNQMDSIGDDNQLRFIRLQNLSQQLTATMQAASSISKALYDVEKAIIGVIGH